eukprot:4234063-Alexandrium_andersonii.AAC.1
MHAGAWGRGAPDATLATAFAVEQAFARSWPFGGAVADLFKCFDRLAPQVVGLALRVAGFPPRLLGAY